ncbi:DUF6262 family protein [Paenibacillus sp. N3.4]|uniref:DUF6262 family protein n=1 Tax=Paenibacillus sp. N3.4 TaxID=2603222 RepID=UPI0011CB1FA6|nr:DUF6262 family protein [Paenibacillus sp. N3.4]TXK85012.1 transposase [Paenibacillus sp. N3.4]
MNSNAQTRQQRNTEGIRKFSEQKTMQACRKAEAAIHKLLMEEVKINFNTVAIEAGVSKPFLYSQPGLRLRIESLRKQTEQAAIPIELMYEELKKENEAIKKELYKLRNFIRKTMKTSDK